MKGYYARKRAGFQRGNIPHNKGCQTMKETRYKKPVRWTRLPRDVQENLRKEILQQAEGQGEVSVKLLRPGPRRQTYLDRYASPGQERPNTDSYRIFHAQRVEELFNNSLQEHLTFMPGCTGQLIFDDEQEKKVGLAWKECLKCTVCNYISKKEKLYKEVTWSNSKGGEKSANMHTQDSI